MQAVPAGTWALRQRRTELLTKLRELGSAIGVVEGLAYALIVVSPLTVYRIKVGVNLSPQRAMLLLLAGALCVEFARRRRKVVLPRRPVVVALGATAAFFVYELLQLTRTEQLDFSGRFIGGFAAGLLIIVVLLLAIDSERALRRGVVAFYVSAVIPLALGLYQLAGASLGFVPTLPFAGLLSTDQLFLGNFSTEVGGLAVPRVPSTLAAPAFFGEFLAFVAIAGVAWLLLVRERRLARVVPVAALVALGIVNLVATFARSAWLLFAVGSVMVAFHARAQFVPALFGPGRRWLVPGLVILCVAAIPILPFRLGDVATGALHSIDLRVNGSDSAVVEQRYAGETLTLNPPVDANSPTASTLTHINLRKEALTLFKQHPLSGVGLGNYGVQTNQVGGVSSAQTYGFTVLAEGGAIGFALFAAMLAALIFAIRQAYLSCPRATELGAALLGLYVVVVLLAVNNLVLYDTLYRDTSFVLLALALAGANIVGGRRAEEARMPEKPMI